MSSSALRMEVAAAERWWRGEEEGQGEARLRAGDSR